MPATPQAPMATNQTIITGPNSRPTAAVPRRCTANSTTMITAVIGTISSSSDGSTTLSPSTAESTEIAGVIMLSPKNSAAPKMPSAASTMAGALRPRAAPPAQQRDQRHDAALAVVVGAHRQQDVGDRDDDHHRPEDQRDDAEHVVRADRDRVRVGRVEHGLQGVDRAGADVAEHHAERADHDGRAQRLPTGRRGRRRGAAGSVCIGFLLGRRPSCRRKPRSSRRRNPARR